MLKRILLSGILLIVLGIMNVFGQDTFFLHENGVTIMCPEAEVGETGVVDGVEYEAVNRTLLVQRRDEGADLTKVCTSLVAHLANMFRNSSFNQEIASWDVSNVTNMNSMFRNSSFNQPIGDWDVSNVTDMTIIFGSSNFNQPIGNWDVSNVTNMNSMFFGSDFDQDIGNWDVSNVIDMTWMFFNTNFDQDISNWNVSNVTDMTRMFGSSNFNQDIGNWNVGNVTNMDFMFSNSSFNQDLGNWDVSNVENMSSMFGSSNFNQDIGSWDVSNVENMSNMFVNNMVFNQDLSNWNVSNVTDMNNMFSNSNFNQDIGSWDVSNVTNMSSMFRNNTVFNQDIGNWDVSNVTDMNNMFSNSNFNQPIGDWDVSSVTDMSAMFSNSNFNQPIGGWDVGNVTNMSGMFRSSKFDEDIGNWDVSNVINMSGMFGGSDFNQVIGNWDVKNVTNMSGMFVSGNFNQDIGNWDVSNVGTMENMFQFNSGFNQDIGNWDVKNVSNMNGMFRRATNFDQNLRAWCVTNIPLEPTDFSVNSALSENNKPVWGTCPVTATPQFSPDPGNYADPVDVTITSSTEGATVFYTLDESTPDTNSTLFESPITVTENTTIKAIATAPDHQNSEIVTANYIFAAFVDLLSPQDGAQNVSLLPTLQWEETTGTEIDSFELQLSSDSEFATIILNQSSIEEATFTVQDSLDFLTTYFWRVRPVVSGENEAWSDTVSFTTVIKVPAITELQTPQNGATGISLTPELSWSESDRAENYQLQLALDESFNTIVTDTSSIEGVSFLIETLNYSTDYFWRVRASNAGGEGEWSEIWTFFTSYALQDPVAETPANNSENIVVPTRFVWLPIDDADDYELQISPNADFDSLLVLESPESNNTANKTTSQKDWKITQVVENLDFETEYYWRVRAENEKGIGQWSDTLSFTTESGLPGVPEWNPGNGEENVSTSPLLSWNESRRAETYQIQLSQSKNFEDVLIDVEGIEEPEYQVEDLDGITTYYWKVQAHNNVGASGWSETLSFTTEISTSNETDSEIPDEFTLNQNYPNPFNPTTQIRYGIPQSAEVDLSIFNMLGQKVVTLVNEKKSTGWHTATFDASGLPSGFYIYRIKVGEFVSTKKLMLIK